MANSIHDRRKRILETRLAQLYEEYEAINAQLGYALNDADKLRLKRQAEHTDGEIQELEQKIAALEPESGVVQAEPDREDDGHETAVNLARVLGDRFDSGELRTFCFHLDIDYDDLPGEGRSSKARELASYLRRYRRVEEAIRLGQELRPDIDWSNL